MTTTHPFREPNNLAARQRRNVSHPSVVQRFLPGDSQCRGVCRSGLQRRDDFGDRPVFDGLRAAPPEGSCLESGHLDETRPTRENRAKFRRFREKNPEK